MAPTDRRRCVYRPWLRAPITALPPFPILLPSPLVLLSPLDAAGLLQFLAPVRCLRLDACQGGPREGAARRRFPPVGCAYLSESSSLRYTKTPCAPLSLFPHARLLPPAAPSSLCRGPWMAWLSPERGETAPSCSRSCSAGRLSGTGGQPFCRSRARCELAACLLRMCFLILKMVGHDCRTSARTSLSFFSTLRICGANK